MLGSGVSGAVLLTLVDIIAIFGGLGMMYDVVVMVMSRSMLKKRSIEIVLGFCERRELGDKQHHHEHLSPSYYPPHIPGLASSNSFMG
jgi:hypothetical protein